MSKVALVTGTSSGIGLSAAVLLAKAGFTVVATMRNLDKATPLRERGMSEGVPLDIRALDVQDQASVETCVRGVMEQYGRIDLLVNNAGMGYLGSMEHTPFADLQRVMDVNFYGVWRMTQAVFPLMREAGTGHIIHVTSVGGMIGQPFNDAYCAAKFAVEGFSESLAPVAKRLGITISLIEPGAVSTEFVSNVQGLPPRPTDDAYGPMLASYISGALEAYTSIAQTPDEVGAIIVEAATSEAPQLRYGTSDLIRGILAHKYVDTTGNSVVALTGARLS